MRISSTLVTFPLSPPIHSGTNMLPWANCGINFLDWIYSGGPHSVEDHMFHCDWCGPADVVAHNLDSETWLSTHSRLLRAHSSLVANFLVIDTNVGGEVAWSSPTGHSRNHLVVSSTL